MADTISIPRTLYAALRAYRDHMNSVTPASDPDIWVMRCHELKETLFTELAKTE